MYEWQRYVAGWEDGGGGGNKTKKNPEGDAYLQYGNRVVFLTVWHK